MERVTVDDLDPTDDGRDRERRGLSGALGTTDVAVNHYRLAPGERISGLHAHGDQEEVFLVVEGEATWETLDGTATVASGELVRFGPGEYQSGTNGSDGEVVVLAMGAPPDSEDVRIPLACPDCGHEYVRPTLAADGETPVLSCPDCGAETDAACSACGSYDVRAALADDGETPVSSCRDCGHESETL